MFDVSHLGSVHVRGAGAFATLQWAFTNDLDRIAPGQGAVHAPARPRRRARGRRHHRVVDRAGRLPGDAQRVEHRAARRRARRSRGVPRRGGVRRSTTSPPTGWCSRSRDPRRARCSRRVAPEAAEVRALRGRAAFEFGGAPGWVAGTGLHGRGRRRAPRARRRRPPRAGRRCSTPASRPPGSARATRCASKPGCRCTATSSAPGITPLQAGLGWVVRFDKGDFRGQGAARGRARPRRRPPAPRPRHRRPADPA